ncbi:hypothetical protein AaE_005171 [Aphanomyces astaci]|uniref:Uncharacterized protein n=1 Tax=Aphanomyces astaci TaxID=112090 RepID=A0A6A5AN68_APHAT|nr:hypothetical protein AaE_005171 [Aphanomyces astaci]
MWDDMGQLADVSNISYDKDYIVAVPLDAEGGSQDKGFELQLCHSDVFSSQTLSTTTGCYSHESDCVGLGNSKVPHTKDITCENAKRPGNLHQTSNPPLRIPLFRKAKLKQRDDYDDQVCNLEL